MKSLQPIEDLLGRVLRIGVLLSGATIAFGLIHFFLSGQSGYSLNTYPTNPLQIFAGTLQAKPFAEIMLGLSLLIVTPIARLVVALILFWKQKDRMFVGITCTVLGILTFSIVFGLI